MLDLLNEDEVDLAVRITVMHMTGVGLLFGHRAQVRRVKQLSREVSVLRERLAYFIRITAWRKSMDQCKDVGECV
tara:strand:+ start:2591 stop:2815 length:225 start_codon:yes stop_codon:yes gene_type:complete